MSVSIIWSSTVGGEAITSIIDHGNAANGAATTPEEIFIRHDGGSNITNVALYIREYSGSYSGSATAAADIAEIINWGDQTAEDDFGGFFINFNAATSYATGWPTYSDKSPTGGFVHRTGYGDSESNAIDLPTSTGATATGEIQTGSAAPGVRFQAKIAVPTNEDTAGVRQWETVLRYTYTS